jgi:hypothetical protein
MDKEIIDEHWQVGDSDVDGIPRLDGMFEEIVVVSFVPCLEEPTGVPTILLGIYGAALTSEASRPTIVHNCLMS